MSGTDISDLENLAYLLDDVFRVPGINYRFGLDGLLGLIPVVGDWITFVPSAYIVYRAWQLGVPRGKLIEMGLAVTIETLIGTVPILGDLVDFVWKANDRNLAIIKRHVQAEG